MTQPSANTRARRDWEDLGRIDPEWAILSESDKRLGGWDPREFFETGQAEVADVMLGAQQLRMPLEHGRALDVGCGIGRLTRALSQFFDEVVGIDISEPMVARAHALHQSKPGIRFLCGPADDLSALPSHHFDLVLSKIVMQHLPTQQSILNALAEMVRVLRPDGLIVVQTTSWLPVRHRVQPRSRIYRALRTAGLPADVLYQKLHLQPMRMTMLPRDKAERLFLRNGARVLDREIAKQVAGVVWTTYWVSK